MTTYSLKQQTEALYAEYQQTLPKEVMAVIDGATGRLVASGIGDRCLQKGDRIPMFELPDALGIPVNIARLLERGPVVLSFYRGGWCTFCNLELKALRDSLDEIRARGAELVAVTPQKPEGTAQTIAEHGLTFPVLTDHDNHVARSFGLAFAVDEALRPIYENLLKLNIPVENGVLSYELPVTATYVVARDGGIIAAFTDPNFANRMDPCDVVAAIPR